MNRHKLEFTKERDEKIQSEVCSRYGLEWSMILSKSRVREVVDARRLYIGILRDVFRLTLQEIGNILNKNHATILHNVNKHEIFVKILKSYKKNYEEIERALMLDNNYYIHEVKEVERKMEDLSKRLEELIERKNNYKLKIQNNGREKLCSK